MSRTRARRLVALLVFLVPLAAGAAPGAGPASGEGEPVAELCGERTVRFFASAADRDARRPSLALAAPLAATGPAPAAFPVRPVFQRVDGRAAARIETRPGTSLYGAGEAVGPLLRDGRRVVAWNLDAHGYGEDGLNRHQSHPWVLAVRADGSAFGVLADTSHRCLLDLTGGILIVADGPGFPLLVVDRDSPREVLTALAELVGTMPLPPLWALGYHQRRRSYTPDARVREIAREFRRRRLPCDAIWLDIDTMDGHRSFTFHPRDFPEPERLLRDLRHQGFHTVAVLDPGIAAEPGHQVYDSGTARDVWVRDAAGEPYRGAVRPGSCVFPDFTRAAARDWWGGLVGAFLAHGIDGLGNDMNEPTILRVDGKTMPLDVRHRADPELGGSGTHARYHNVYGMLMARATREGMLAARPDRRPFVMSRADFLGGQRHAAAWTGDNRATWEHLDLCIPVVLNLGLSGQPFCGPDIGGFAGDGDAQLFARWMGIGALLPFARGSTGKGTRDKEPWAFGRDAEEACRLALQRRYRLLPYLYTLFEEASRVGLPVARPLFFAAPAAPELRGEDDAFLLGDDLLVAARTTPGPRLGSDLSAFGDWPEIDGVFGDASRLDQPDLRLRPGAVVPLGPPREHTGQRRPALISLLICPDAAGRAAGELYEDDGEGFAYREGAFRRLHYAARLEPGAVVVESTILAGDWERPERRVDLWLFAGGTARHLEPVPGSASMRWKLTPPAGGPPGASADGPPDGE